MRRGGCAGCCLAQTCMMTRPCISFRRVSGKENCFAAAVVTKEGDAPRANAPRHLVLHQPSDAGNAGTILRTALGFGFQDIAIIPPAVDIYDPRVIRASMGG